MTLVKVKKADKMEAEQVLNIFKSSGGLCDMPAAVLQEKALQVRGFVFDWDGVFHAGHKGENYSSLFSEADSMGVNMLRYGYWRRHSELPFTAIISGERDQTALAFAGREHFHAIYTGMRNKKNALDHACAAAGMRPPQVACIFDDINDLAMVKHCGLKIQIRRTAAPLFMEYTLRNGLCDYITAHPAREHAVRECCELLLGLWGNYRETVASRTAFDTRYQDYWQARNHIDTRHYTRENEQIVLGKQGGREADD